MSANLQWQEPFVFVDDSCKLTERSIAGRVSFRAHDRRFSYDGQITGSLMIESLAQLAAMLLQARPQSFQSFLLASIQEVVWHPLPAMPFSLDMEVVLTQETGAFITFSGQATLNGQSVCQAIFSVFVA